MKPIKRRALLRGSLAGACVSIALPALEAMMSPRGSRVLFAGTAEGASEAPPVRLLTVMFRNGVLMSKWTPSTAGKNYELPACLTPLEARKSQINVITGLFNPGPAAASVGGGHARGSGAFANGLPITATGASGISVDQIAARELGGATRLRSLVVAPEGHPTQADYDGASDSCNHLSWTDKNTPVPPEVDPVALFDRLFADGVDPGAAAALRLHRKSVLDAVMSDIERLNKRLGASDKKRLDAHLSAVRDLELQAAAVSNGCETPERPVATDETGVQKPFASEKRVKLMMDLVVQAMACDLTRFGSFSLGLDVLPRLFEKFGERRDHHSISHDGSQANEKVIEEYSRYQVEVFAYLLDRMAEVDEGGDKSLLDNSVVYFANQIAIGDLHTHDNLPVILAGSAGGQIPTGRHIHLLGDKIIPGRRDGTQHIGRSVNDLFLTLLRCVGVTGVSTFGLDGTAPLDLA
jgi:hypothetical protein